MDSQSSCKCHRQLHLNVVWRKQMEFGISGYTSLLQPGFSESLEENVRLF